MQDQKFIFRGLIMLCMLIVTHGAYCQQGKSERKYDKNAFAVGALGHARGIFSLGYERMFKDARIKPLIYTAGVGIGYTWGSRESKQKALVYFPIEAGALVGIGSHYAHVKVGYTGCIGEERMDTTYNRRSSNVKNESAYIVSVGYRFMVYNDVIAEVSPMTLVWTNNPNRRFVWSFGFSIGAGF